MKNTGAQHSRIWRSILNAKKKIIIISHLQYATRWHSGSVNFTQRQSTPMNPKTAANELKLHVMKHVRCVINPLKPNDAYTGRTAPLTSRRCILYIYSTNICTEYFKHAAHSLFFSLQNAVYFIILSCLVAVLFEFYIQGVLKFKCKIPAPKG